MSKNFVKLGLIAIIVLSFGLLAIAGDTVYYTWDPFNVGFSIPKSHSIKKSSGTVFESGDNNTWLELYPYKDASETAKGMVEKLVATSDRGLEMEEEGEYESGGWHGYWLRCHSSKWPEWKFWVIGFIDPASENNFYAHIWWKPGVKTAYKVASDMSYSFKKLK